MKNIFHSPKVGAGKSVAKRLVILSVFFSLIFSACGGEETANGTEENGDNAYTYTYKTAEFQMEVLKDWEVIDSFTSEYPDELRVAFRSKVKDSIFTPNITVLVEENTGNSASYDFAQRKLSDHEDTLLNYELLGQETVTLTVAGAESKTILSTFEGKNETAGPTLEFMQVTLTEGEDAWIVTASTRPGQDEFLTEQMDAMLRSFTLR
ncbi:hypothetical protein A3J23_01605 [Candidatus Peregrinibacteria bacterium RIFCSPLOWO2_02_FULL_48_14]|nr:MAG: hypothetical protein A3J23_01605 [Candidatus Peregrinibacteria bacterium RIFCSPLOWO2_02_FULL_48_14]